MIRRLSLPLLVAFVSLPGTAFGSNVTSDFGIHFSALPGEANDVSIFYEPEIRPMEPYRVADNGADLAPGMGCRGVTDNEVVCSETVSNTAVQASLGDGDDHLTWSSPAFPALGATPDSANYTTLIVNAEVGSDEVTGSGGRDAFFGSDGTDELNGGAGDDYLLGDDFGSDSLDNDSLDGGPGADQLFSFGGEDIMQGGDGNDSVEDHTGLPGDNVQVDPGTDLLHGGEGDDELSAQATGGTNELDGGEGNDTMSFATGSGLVGAPPPPDLPGQYSLTGGGGDDMFAVNGAVPVDAGAGNDIVNVDGGSVVAGGAGDDHLTGIGANSLDGGDGADLINGGDGNDTLLGGPGMDRIEGRSGDDEIDGGSEDDSLLGSYGNDSISGSAGNDQLFADDGNDTLSGGDGDDLLLALDRTGVDTVGCGAGADQGDTDPIDVVAIDCEKIGGQQHCPASASSCDGTVTLSAKEPAGSAKARQPAHRPKTLILGSQKFHLKGGKKEIVAVKLSRKARKFVNQRGRVRAKATVETQVKLRSGKKTTVVTHTSIVLVKPAS